MFIPTHSISRIRAQDGAFTVHLFSSKNKRFVPLQKNTQLRPKLMRVLVNPRNIKTLREELDHLGAHAASAFPDLDGLCGRLANVHGYLESCPELNRPKKIKKPKT